MSKALITVLAVLVTLILVGVGRWLYVRDRGADGSSESTHSDQPSRPGQLENLAARCQQYLSNGPPEHMTDYVPGSLTEIVIAHGAKMEPLDPELREIASIILIESEDLNSIEDQSIREYMLQGASLVEEVLIAYGGQGD